MRFFILGNINAGKRTFTEFIYKIMCQLGKYEILRIDDFRKKYGDGSEKSEIKIARYFAKTILETENAIVELCGFGYAAKEILKKMRDNSCVVLYINAPLQICLERIEAKRKIFESNNHFAESTKIADTIRLLDATLKSGKLYEMWDRIALGWHTIEQDDFMEAISKLPLKQYHYTGEMINILKKNGFNKLISYGSLGRLDMSLYSDIDLILLSKFSKEQVFDMIQDHLQEIFKESVMFILGEKIVILKDDIMVELAIIQSFKEYVKYYCGSYINNVSKTILLGGKKLCGMITKATQAYRDSSLYKNESYDLKLCKDKIQYYFFFLKKMAIENDCFRFYFYNSLIIDSIVRYLCIKEGIVMYLYCPKHINHIMAKYKIKHLVYDMNEDKHSHIKKVKTFVEKWIE